MRTADKTFLVHVEAGFDEMGLKGFLRIENLPYIFQFF